MAQGARAQHASGVDDADAVTDMSPPSETTFLPLGGPSVGGLTDRVVALGDVRRAPGGLGVRRAGSGQVAVELVQVAADGMPPGAVAEPLAQPIGLEQPRAGTEQVADRARAAEHGGCPT